MKERYTAERQSDLLSFLCRKLCAVPKSRIRIQIKRGEVRVNGVKTHSSVNLKQGDTVEIFLPEKFAADKLKVLYEDSNIIVVDKPPFTESEFQLPELVKRQCGCEVSAVHRLDTNTTGVLILAKSDRIKNAFINEFKRGNIKKLYSAQVFGSLPDAGGRLIAYAVKNSADSYCKVYKNAVAGSKEIITDYTVLSSGEISTLQLSPVTGRTHQLRAHLAFMGCPIVGDDKYGNTELNLKVGAKYQRLRAVSVAFDNMSAPLSYLNGITITADASSDNGF